MDHEPEVWLSIGAAAEAAGVARRSAFRWVARAAIPTRLVGRRRLVEVGALRLFAANRGRATRAALFSATGGSTDCSAPPPRSTPEHEALLAAAVSVTLVEDQVAALWPRIERIERALGLLR